MDVQKCRTRDNISCLTMRNEVYVGTNKSNLVPYKYFFSSSFHQTDRGIKAKGGLHSQPNTYYTKTL